MIRKRGFEPIVNEHIRVLVLGSLPGDASLAQSQYYGHRQNRFWQLMAEVIDVDLPPLDYPARIEALLENGVGLWDVIAEAQRDHANNDLVGLLSELPHLTTIAFNGGTAARLGLKALHEYASRYRIVKLPSSSPAHTLPYSEKLSAWLALKDFWRN
jgi:hypoxanthine-DNA glycosylase